MGCEIAVRNDCTCIFFFLCLVSLTFSCPCASWWHPLRMDCAITDQIHRCQRYCVDWPGDLLLAFSCANQREKEREQTSSVTVHTHTHYIPHASYRGMALSRSATDGGRFSSRSCMITASALSPLTTRQASTKPSPRSGNMSRTWAILPVRSSVSYFEMELRPVCLSCLSTPSSPNPNAIRVQSYRDRRCCFV